ncbi:hypothetical protein GDO81_025493 [Engystomops pustulosus]|uniref:Uncharacterized protein n=1 Tax=Engystomops pustulosus TaxID=76066 RepID=A0AAV6YIF2_ENGPU|nr:hypothetical protein GDO81_025493 [Engystomops pustulosus]
MDRPSDVYMVYTYCRCVPYTCMCPMNLTSTVTDMTLSTYSLLYSCCHLGFQSFIFLVFTTSLYLFRDCSDTIVGSHSIRVY